MAHTWRLAADRIEWQKLFSVLGDPDLVEAEEEAVGHEEFEQRLDKPGESVEWHAGASASKKKKKKKTKGLVRQEDQVPEEKKKAKKQKNDLPEDNHMHAGKKQRVEGKTKTSEPPQEDTTPPKKKAKVEMDSLQTPEKVSGGPLHVDQCRPAAFGKRQTPADTKLAKAKAPVKVERSPNHPWPWTRPKKLQMQRARLNRVWMQTWNSEMKAMIQWNSIPVRAGNLTSAAARRRPSARVSKSSRMPKSS